MAQASLALSSQHPERIHPAVWRASQLARAAGATTSTGFPALDHELPGQGWPLGTLIEFLPTQSGIGELSLLQPALASQSCKRSIFLVNPPYPPHFHCWFNWNLEAHRLRWITPQSSGDTLWATEQILRHNACATLLCWAGPLRAASLRRLHLAARQSEVLFFMMRPASVANQASAAPLRLCLQPSFLGVDVHIIKRRGPPCEQIISLPLFPPALTRATQFSQYARLDQPLPAHA